MKNRKLVLFITGLLVVVLLFQLSFTYFASRTESKLKTKYTADGILDKDAYSKHLDSISNKTIFDLGLVEFTYNECKSRELGLGLDLRGGMNVILEVSKSEVLENFAGEYNANRPAFKAALQKAIQEDKDNNADFVETFAAEYKAQSKGKSLAIAFMNADNKGEITNGSSDDEVINYLKTELSEGIDRAYEVLETRLNQSSISQNTIQKLDGGRISVEIPGAENPARIRTLLEKSANLEFWNMYENNPKNGFLATRLMFELDSFLATLPKYAKKDKADNALEGIEGDSAVKEETGLSSLAEAAIEEVEENTDNGLQAIEEENADTSNNAVADNSEAKDSASLEAERNNRRYPLFELMSPNIGNQQYNPGPALGYVPKYNLKELKELLNSEEVKSFLPADWVFAFDAEPSEDGGFYVVYGLQADNDGEARMSGDMIKNAYADNDPNAGGVVVTMSMKPDAAEDWEDLTGENASGEEDKQYVAVVLDGSVYSAPGVSEPISGGNTQISGQFDLKEAQDLANILKAGKLPVPLQIIGEDVVGPSLGEESINSGFKALIMGFIAIMLFMIAYYNRAGFIADLAVLVNVFFIMGTLASRGAALTLPGIAGLLLTIGMAVDANVLIYERIKEELASGKTLKTSIQLGYKAAFSAILDANVTSLISGFILLSAGTGPVYGFAIILIIGIFSSLFTALLISRLIIEGRVAKGKEINFETGLSSKILKNPSFNFVTGRKKFYMISGLVIAIGLVGLFSRGIPLGLDFKGGYAYTIQFDQDKDIRVDDIKSKVGSIGANASAEVKKIGSNNRFKVTTSYLIDNTNKGIADTVRAEVVNALSDLGVQDPPADSEEKSDILESAKVGPTMASSTKNKSLIVTILAIIAMFTYIVIRFRDLGFGLGATLALVHDVLIIFGLYALLNGVLPFPLELDQTFIAALLTLIGYSINDTVVVFDRIRESLGHAKGTKTPIESIINKAINSTLSRTLVTSGTTLLAVLLLFLFGGPGLKGFSFTLIIGILVGTYSSIFIATPVVVDMMKRRLKKS
jgi:SecD/SecF fusion protein